jgi:hypothetical protein
MEASLTKTRIFEIYLNVIETPGLLRRQRLILGRKSRMAHLDTPSKRAL